MSEGVVKSTQSPEDIAAYMEGDLFFNITPITERQALATLKGMAADKECTTFLKSTKLWSPKKSWKGIPEEAESHTATLSSLHDIMVEVYQHFHKTKKPEDGTATSEAPTENSSGGRRRSQRSKAKAPPVPLAAPPKPDRGVVILPATDRIGQREHKPLPDGIITGLTNHFKPSAKEDSWCRAITAFDVQTDVQTQTDEVWPSGLWIYHLGYYAQEMFATQKTRHFVFGVIFTESRLRIYRLDRCGAVRWPWLDYHDDPMVLIRALLLIGNQDPETVGVDSTVTFNAENQRVFHMIHNGEPVEFTAVETIFSDIDLLDRATMCWGVKDKDGKSFLLKQQFVDPKRGSEWPLLEHVDIPGIVKMHFEQHFGLVSKSRGIRQPFPDTFYDRGMVRGVYDRGGAHIDEPSSRMALIVALRDAIAGHMELWLEHDVLHRDISFGNILFTQASNVHTTDAKMLKRPHGIIIDFDLSIHWDPELPRDNYVVDATLVNPAFQSTMRVSSATFDDKTKARWKPLHDHIDELEAFFWVLFWATNLYPPPDNPAYKRARDAHRAKHGNLDDFIEPSSDLRKEFDNDDVKTAFEFKRKVINTDNHEILASAGKGWGRAIDKLVHNFAKFCYTRYEDKLGATGFYYAGKKVPSKMEASRAGAEADYEKVLKIFDEAIEALERELAVEKLRRQQQKDARKPTARMSTGGRRPKRKIEEVEEKSAEDAQTETEVEETPKRKHAKSAV